MADLGQVILESVLTCPVCGFSKMETMPVDYCQVRYTCSHCGTVLKPKAGDCCVYCSYGTVPCPSMQTPDQTDEVKAV